MRYFFNFCLAYIFLAISAPEKAWAGEPQDAGFTLTEDSYVFTIDEATRLMARMQELEIKEKELDKYKQLDEVRIQQIDAYKISVDLSKSQIDRYIELDRINQQAIGAYATRKKFDKIENIGYFALGLVLTAGSFIAADSVITSLHK